MHIRMYTLVSIRPSSIVRTYTRARAHTCIQKRTCHAERAIRGSRVRAGAPFANTASKAQKKEESGGKVVKHESCQELPGTARAA